MSKVHSGYGKAKRSLLGAFERVAARAKPYKKKFKRSARYVDKEVKFADQAILFSYDTTLEIPAGSNGNLLDTLIAQGDGQSNRDGRKIVITSMHLRGSNQMAPGAAATAASICYLWLVQDKQCNGATAVAAEPNTGVFTTANAATTFRTLANVDRFKILKKWVLPINANAGAAGSLNNRNLPFEYFTKCNIPIEYDASAATGALATIRTNNIFLVCGSDGGQDDIVTFTGSCRFRFVG